MTAQNNIFFLIVHLLGISVILIPTHLTPTIYKYLLIIVIININYNTFPFEIRFLCIKVLQTIFCLRI